MRSQWKENWRSAQVVNFSLVDDPTIWQPGFNLPRQQWSLLNRCRTAQGHCGVCKKLWNQAAADLCPCGESHIVDSCCRLMKLNHGGLSQLHSADDEAIAWLLMHTQEEEIGIQSWLFLFFCVYYMLLYILLRMHVCFCSVRLSFSLLSQEVGWEEHLLSDLFYVGWHVQL